MQSNSERQGSLNFARFENFYLRHIYFKVSTEGHKVDAFWYFYYYAFCSEKHTS